MAVGGGGGLVSGGGGGLCCIRYCHFHLVLLFARALKKALDARFLQGRTRSSEGHACRLKLRLHEETEPKTSILLERTFIISTNTTLSLAFP